MSKHTKSITYLHLNMVTKLMKRNIHCLPRFFSLNLCPLLFLTIVSIIHFREKKKTFKNEFSVQEFQARKKQMKFEDKN